MIYLTPSQADAEFYRLVHDLLEARSHHLGPERRAEQRIPVWTKHRIAPLEGPGVPSGDQFEEVICLDIQRSGFSFLRSEPPHFRKLVAEFGTPTEPLYLVAEVVHFRPVLFSEGGFIEPLVDEMAEEAPWLSRGDFPRGLHGGPERRVRMFHIGCRFVGRLAQEEIRPQQKQAGI